jgi:flagellar protein FlbD
LSEVPKLFCAARYNRGAAALSGGSTVIKVTRFNHTEVILNADLIEFIEATPDTVITMITGKKVLVRETADEVRVLAIDYRRSIGPVLPRPAMLQPDAAE